VTSEVPYQIINNFPALSSPPQWALSVEFDPEFYIHLLILQFRVSYSVEFVICVYDLE